MHTWQSRTMQLNGRNIEKEKEKKKREGEKERRKNEKNWKSVASCWWLGIIHRVGRHDEETFSLSFSAQTKWIEGFVCACKHPENHVHIKPYIYTRACSLFSRHTTSVYFSCWAISTTTPWQFFFSFDLLLPSRHCFSHPRLVCISTFAWQQQSPTFPGDRANVIIFLQFTKQMLLYCHFHIYFLPPCIFLLFITFFLVFLHFFCFIVLFTLSITNVYACVYVYVSRENKATSGTKTLNRELNTNPEAAYFNQLANYCLRICPRYVYIYTRTGK